MAVNPYLGHPWEDEIVEWSVPLSSPITIDLRSDGFNWGPILLAGPTTLANPQANIATVGKRGYMRFQQDQEGNHQVNLGTSWDLIGANQFVLAPYSTTILNYIVVTPVLIQYWTTVPLGPFDRVYQVQSPIFPALDASLYEKNVQLIAPPALSYASARFCSQFISGNAHLTHGATATATLGSLFAIISGQLIIISSGGNTTIYVNPPVFSSALAKPLSTINYASPLSIAVNAAIGLLPLISYTTIAPTTVTALVGTTTWELLLSPLTAVTTATVGEPELFVPGTSALNIVNATATVASYLSFTWGFGIPNATAATVAAILSAGPVIGIVQISALATIGSPNASDFILPTISVAAASVVGVGANLKSNVIQGININASVNSSVSFFVAAGSAACVASVGTVSIVAVSSGGTMASNPIGSSPVA